MSIDYIFEGIKKDYSKGEIPGWLDREILNWLDDDWQETHQIEYDWYTEFCNGEAEDVIINEMINHGIEKYNNKEKLAIDKHCRLDERLREYYDIMCW